MVLLGLRRVKARFPKGQLFINDVKRDAWMRFMQLTAYHRKKHPKSQDDVQLLGCDRKPLRFLSARAGYPAPDTEINAAAKERFAELDSPEPIRKYPLAAGSGLESCSKLQPHSQRPQCVNAMQKGC